MATEDAARTLGKLGPCLRLLQAAVADATDSFEQVQRTPFVEGLEALVPVLDSWGGGWSSYLTSNIQKLHNAKTESSEQDYRLWLVSELPVHVATSSYVDDSAWMGSEWVGATMAFFAEFFAEIHEGKEAKAGAEAAYARTLALRHNWMQKAAFNVGLMRMPGRQAILQILSEDGAATDVMTDIGEFVTVGRAVATCCDKLRAELKAMQVEGKKAKK